MTKTTNIIITFLISILMLVFLVLPKYQAFSQKRQVTFQKQMELRGQKQYQNELQSLSEELKKYSAELEKIDSALPSKFSLLSFLNYLQKITSESGLILKSYSYSSGSSPAAKEAKTKGSEIKEMYVDLNVSGSFNSFKSLLSVFERSPKFIEIEKISFSSSEKGEATDFNIGIKLYSY
jgi:Tfp pilus assembly protein PilO